MPSNDPARRLRDIIYSIERIEQIVARAGGLAEAVDPHNVLRDAIERRLLIISEAAVKLGADMEIGAPQIDWRGVRGIGNVLRHGYDQVEAQTLALVISRELPPLKLACAKLLEDLA